MLYTLLSTAEARWAAVSKTSMPINTEISLFSLHIQVLVDKCHTEKDNNQDMYGQGSCFHTAAVVKTELGELISNCFDGEGWLFSFYASIFCGVWKWNNIVNLDNLSHERFFDICLSKSKDHSIIVDVGGCLQFETRLFAYKKLSWE